MKSKKLIIGGIVTTISVATILPTTIIAIKQVQINNYLSSNTTLLNNKLVFNNRVFNSKEELLDYALESSSKLSNEQSSVYKFTIANDPIKTELGSVQELKDYIDGKITKDTWKHTKDIRTNSANEVVVDDEKYLTKSSDTTRIYRGKNNTYHETETEAKESYFEPHNVYFWKNTYFRNERELYNYLYKNQEELWDNKPASIKLKAPNGHTSQQINIKDIGDPERGPGVKEYIKNFVRVNAIRGMTVDSYIDGGVDTQYYTEENIKNFQENYPPNYLKINSNGNQGKAIVDVFRKDSGKFNGSYYTNYSDSLKSITNKDLWSITNTVDRASETELDNLQIFNNFFDMTLQLNLEPVGELDISSNKFFYLPGDTLLQAKINNYFDVMNEKYNSIYQKLLEMFQKIKSTKRYSSFYKIPLLFLFTMDQIFYNLLPQTLVDDTRNIYIQICDYYDKELLMQLGPEKLTNSKGEVFSFKRLFGFENYNLDLNQDIEGLAVRMMTEYPGIINTAKVLAVTSTIKSRLGDTGDMSLNYDLLSKNYNLQIDKDDELYYNLVWYTSNTSDYSFLSTGSQMLFTGKNPEAFVDDFEIVAPTGSGISQQYFDNFINQWINTIIIKEAIRYSLTQDSWIYTKKQKELIQSLGFMRLLGNSESYMNRYNDDMKYMRELYTLNNGEIENIIFIILSMFHSMSDRNLRSIFGNPEKYNDKFKKKIYDKFQQDILSDFDKFLEKSSNVFTMELENMSRIAHLYDFEFKEDPDFGTKYLTPGDETLVEGFRLPTNPVPRGNLISALVPENYPKAADPKKDPNKKNLQKSTALSNLKWQESNSKPQFAVGKDGKGYITNPHFHKTVYIDTNESNESSRFINTRDTFPPLYPLPPGPVIPAPGMENPFFPANRQDRFALAQFIRNPNVIEQHFNQNFVNIAQVLVPNRNIQQFNNIITGYKNAYRQSSLAYGHAILAGNDSVARLFYDRMQMINHRAELLTSVNSLRMEMDRTNAANVQAFRTIGANVARNAQSIEVLSTQIGHLNYNLGQLADVVHTNQNVFQAFAENTNSRLTTLENDVAQIKTEMAKNKKSALIGNIVNGIFTGISLAMSIVNMILTFSKKVNVSYSYKAKDSTYFWDGGYKSTAFWGLMEVESKGLESMSIAEPITIVQPNNLEGYYYNGKLFSTDDEVRIAQVNDILGGRYKNPNIKPGYSFKKLNNNSLQKEYYFNKLEDLCDNVYNEIFEYYKSWLSNPKATLPSIAEESGYLVDDLIYVTVNKDEDPKVNIERILENIKPALIAYLPKIDQNTNYPKSNDNLSTSRDDESVPEYHLPYVSWTSNKFNVNTREDECIIVDPNYGSNKGKTPEELKSTLRTMFFNKFDVPSKDVLNNDLLYNVKYSDFNPIIKDIDIYTVKGANGQIKKFSNRKDAEDFVWTSYGIEIYTYSLSLNQYLFQSNIFDSKQEYLKWVLENTKGA